MKRYLIGLVLIISSCAYGQNTNQFGAPANPCVAGPTTVTDVSVTPAQQYTCAGSDGHTWVAMGGSGGGAATGSTVPRGKAAVPGATYVQTFTDGATQTCTASATGLNWVCPSGVYYAGSSALVGGPTGVYPITTGSGTSLIDTSGNSNNLAFGTTAPTWNGTNGINVSGGKYVTVPTSWLVDGSTFMVCLQTTNNSQTAVIGASGARASVGFDKFMRPGTFDGGGIGISVTSMGSSLAASAYPTCITYVLDSTAGQHIYVGTQETPSYYSLTNLISGTKTAVGLGSYPDTGTWSMSGVIYKFVYWAGSGGHTTLTQEQIQHNADVMDSQLVAQGDTANVGFAGANAGGFVFEAGVDSITQGTAASANNAGGYPAYVAQFLGYPMQTVNTGVGGLTICNTIAQNYFTPLRSYLGGISTRFLNFTWGGTNDIVASTSPATTYACDQTDIRAARAAGEVTMQATMNPRADCTGTCETNRQAYNALILAGQYADGLVDMGSDLRFQNPTFSPFTTTDGIHPVDIGYQVVAGRIINEMNRLGVTGNGGQQTPCVPYSATPNFDLSKGLKQCMLLTGNVSKFTVSNYNQGTNFQINFVQDGTGGRTVAIGNIGSGATATAPLTGTLPVFTLGSGGTNYSAAWPPTIVASGGTCTTQPAFLATVSGGAITGATTKSAGNCSVAPTLTFVSTEPAWHSPSALVTTTAGTTTTLDGTYDSTAANVTATLSAAQ